MKFSILHPTRRPSKSIETIDKWFNYFADSSTLEIVVSVDVDDPNLKFYNYNFDRSPFVQCKVVINKNKSAVDAINNAAKASSGDVLIVVSDDTEPYLHWDAMLKNSVGSKKDWILKTQDGIQPWIITMPIMDRAYYNRFGYIYHPDYLHMFCDTELTCVADITGRKLTSNLLFPHKHYSVTKEQPDAINKKADATWAQGEKLFLERHKRNFDLPAGLPIQDKYMIDWLKKR